MLAYFLAQDIDIAGNGANVTLPWGPDSEPSREILELLIAHGWDIDSRGPRLGSRPLLWRVAHDHDLVEWCLANGASVDPPDDAPPGVDPERRPILERAATRGNIATYELLQAHGAPTSRRELPNAVESAIVYTLRTGRRDVEMEAGYKRLLGMTLHLVDVRGKEVNELCVWPGTIHITPLA